MTDQASALTRVTVNLTPLALGAMTAAMAKSGLGKTDTINRALKVYKLILDMAERDDGALCFVDPDGTVNRLYVL